MAIVLLVQPVLKGAAAAAAGFLLAAENLVLLACRNMTTKFEVNHSRQVELCAIGATGAHTWPI